MAFEFHKPLILGGAGFIGSHLAKSLVESGKQVKIFTRNSRSVERLAPILKDIKIVHGDFTDEFAVKTALQDVDCVFHFITSTFPNTSIHSGAYDIQSNLIPTVRLLEEAESLGVKKLVYLSSGGTVYGDQEVSPIKETAELNPISIYGNSKKLVESYLNFFSQHANMDIDILRVSNPYGPNQNLFGVQGLIPVACACLRDDREFTVIGKGDSVRDYIYIDDLIDAVNRAASIQGSKTVNISSSCGTSVAEIIDLLENIAGKKMIKTHLPERSDYVRSNVLCNQKAEQLLDWKPQINLEEGVRLIWEWVNGTQGAN